MGKETQQPRKLFIMRHAERLDFVMGRNTDWISTSFDKEGKYIRSNMNMPLTIPKRRGGPKDFQQDSPLTRIGLLQATFAGEAMKSSGITFSHVFSSPALRCMETCRTVLKETDQTHLSINIEPGLFEFMEWHAVSGMPKWMSPDEFKDNGFNVCEDYEPVMKESEVLTRKETSEEYYERSFKVTSDIVKKCEGNILLVGHGSSHDVCSRQLIGKQPRNMVDLMKTAKQVPYAAVAVVEDSGPEWKLVDPPFPSFTHLGNEAFQWRTALE